MMAVRCSGFDVIEGRRRIYLDIPESAGDLILGAWWIVRKATSAPPVRPDDNPMLAPFCTLNRAAQDHQWREYEAARAEWESQNGEPL